MSYYASNMKRRACPLGEFPWGITRRTVELQALDDLRGFTEDKSWQALYTEETLRGFSAASALRARPATAEAALVSHAWTWSEERLDAFLFVYAANRTGEIERN